MLSELVRNGAKRIVVLSGHAGKSHMTALKEAGKMIVSEKDIKLMVLSDYDIAYKWKDDRVPEDDGHAGTLETSRIMAITPELVKERPELFCPGFPDYIIEKDARQYWTGCYHGDPSKASAEIGNSVNEFIVENLTRLINEL